MNGQRSLLAVAIALGIAGCGSDSSDSSTTDTGGSTATSASLTAKAADGYLVGANACLDLNSNKVCDKDEPNAVTGDDGSFTIDNLTQEQLEQGTLLIEVVAGQTIDTDNPGVVLSKSYRLTAPPKSAFISPLTTLIQNEIESGSSLEEAKTAIQEKLGTTLDLTQDYIEAKNNNDLADAQKAAFENLHRVAQVTASVMAENTDALSETAVGAGISVEALTALINEEVTRVLEEVVKNIEAAGDNFNPSDIAGSINRDHIAIDDSNLEDKIKENEANKGSKQADLAKLIKTDGINWFGGDNDTGKDLVVAYGTLKSDADNSVTDTSYIYDYFAEQFVEFEYTPDTNSMVLGQNGWEASDDTLTSIKPNEDGSLTLESRSSIFSEVASAKQLDISGLNVRSIMDQTDDENVWSNIMPVGLKFPDNTTAYKLSVEDISDNIYTFYKGDWCAEHAPDRYEALNNMCNGISAFKNGSDTWLATLASTIAEDESDRHDTASNNHADLIPMAGMESAEIFAQLLSNGTVVYYTRAWNLDSTFSKLSELGSWKDESVNGEVLRQVTIPESIHSQATWSNYQKEDNSAYLSVVEGFVRITYKEVEDAGSEAYVFDEATKQFILDNALTPQPLHPLNLQACLDSLPDAEFIATANDVTVYDVQRTPIWDPEPVTQNLTYEFIYLGNTFSWLNDVTLVTGLPSWISDLAGSLEKTRIDIKDPEGTLMGYEYSYSSEDHYLGQEGFNSDDSLGWGSAKALLPLTIADNQKIINQMVDFGTSTNAPLASQFDYWFDEISGEEFVTEYPGLRTVSVETSLNDIINGQPYFLPTFNYQETYLGKEEVTVPAGTFAACKVTSETQFENDGPRDTQITWLTNRGSIKSIREESSWGMSINMEATSLPTIK
ncbi:Lipoprotein [Vibrio crassostreae]|nr:Lipoprotein [Vibrio crassostreae]CAK2290411.1 Lipoprotein [Vibrio crassostreae]CAK2469549.1 Lipoprotein [Vibrio crassostreae]CAK2732073.1 Lipoprotein [Vibrio crassostreae]